MANFEKLSLCSGGNLNFSQRLDLRSSNKHVALQNLCLLHMEKYKETV